MNQTTAGHKAKQPFAVCWAIAAILVGAIVIAVGASLFLPSKEPLYKGKTATMWLHECTTNTAEAVEAFNALGTNAVPPLIRVIGYNEPRVKRKLRQFATKQGWTLLALPLQPKVSWEVRRIALQRMKVLVPQARSTLPDFAALVLNDDLEAAMAALSVLEAFDDAATEALITALAESKHPEIRMMIAQWFGRMKPPPEAAIGPLIVVLADPDPRIRMGAALSLGQIGKRPGIVVPALEHSLKDNDGKVRGNAIHSLGRFGPEAKACVPLPYFAQRSRCQCVRRSKNSFTPH